MELSSDQIKQFATELYDAIIKGIEADCQSIARTEIDRNIEENSN